MSTPAASPSKAETQSPVKQDPAMESKPTPAKKRKGVDPSSSKLLVKLLSEHARLPTRGSPLAAGYDLSSAHDATITAKERGVVKTDLAIALPEGTYGRIAPRSGLAVKSGIDVGAGVVDADYRGPLSIVLFNHGDTDFEIKKGDRVAQLVIEVIATPEVEAVKELEDTQRGVGGFGSTGVATDVTNTVEKSITTDKAKAENEEN